MSHQRGQATSTASGTNALVSLDTNNFPTTIEPVTITSSRSETNFDLNLTSVLCTTTNHQVVMLLPVQFTVTRPNAPASEVAANPNVTTTPTNTIPRDEIVDVKLKIPPLANQDLTVTLDVTPDTMKTQTLATPNDSRGSVQMFDFGTKGTGGTITAGATQIVLKATDNGEETFAAVFNKEGTLNIKVTFTVGTATITAQSQQLTITKQIRKYAKDPSTGYDFNQYDQAFQDAADHWKAVYQHSIDDVERLKAMGMDESEEGEGIPNYTGGQDDIMSYGNPADPDIHVIHNDGTQPSENEIVVSSGTIRTWYYPQAVLTPPADAILWGTCVLYHKAQTLHTSDDVHYTVTWKSWDAATSAYNNGSGIDYLNQVDRAFLEGKHPTDNVNIWPIRTDGKARP